MNRTAKPAKAAKAAGAFLMSALLLCAAQAAAQGLHFSYYSSYNSNTPIGIDFHEVNGGNVIVSANYPTGLPYNLNLIGVPSGIVGQFSNLTGLTDELKIATVRSSAACQQYPIGTVFTANGEPGEIVRIDPNGNISPPAANNAGSAARNSWVKLPGEQYLLRGSLYVDRACSFGGDLIVVTGNGDDPHGGGVWRVAADGRASKLAQIPGKALEGVITLPNNSKYGPWAGSIVAGAETLNERLDIDGVLYSIKPNGAVTTWNLAFTDANGVHHPIKPEDIDIIKAGSDFFGVAYQDGKLLRVPAADFAPYADQVLITQEFPCGSWSSQLETRCAGPWTTTTGLYAVNWNGSSFVVTPLPFAPDSPVQMVRQWEHVTFAPRGDVSITKTTDTPSVSVGDAARYTIVVKSNGPEDAFNVIVKDSLPGNLNWTVGGADASSCSIASGVMSCSYARIPAGSTRTVTLSATTSSASCPSLNNTATVTAGNDANSTNNSVGPVAINVSCVQRQLTELKVEKLPKNGTFTSGSQVNFTIKVTNLGPGAAANVKLVDQLPGNGGLVWQSASTAQGTCVNPIAGNLLTCSLGTIPLGGSVTVTVQSTITTPPAACQLQPNPVALATADASTSAQDSGSINCAPPAPRVAFLKYTNGADANDPNGGGVPLVGPGSTVNWTYRVQNTGNTSVPRSQVVVTDDSGPTPVFGSELIGNGDSNFDPGELWDYVASGIALDLSLPPPAGVRTVAMSCTANGAYPPSTAYVNMGKVTIPGASASDPSSYCNPPKPGVQIVKYTNGVNADDPNGNSVPNIAPGAAVTWTYQVTNSGNTAVPIAQLQVIDNTPGVTPVPIMAGGYVSGDANRNNVFDPGEIWMYQAAGIALDLSQPAPSGTMTVPSACTKGNTQPPSTAYINYGTARIPGAADTDPSVYCNPPPVCELGSSTPTFSGKNMTFSITNNGSKDVTLETLSLGWPSANGKLRAVLFGSNAIDAVADVSGTSVTLSGSGLVADASKRTIPAHGSIAVTLQFSNNAATDVAQYSGTFNFGPNCAVRLNANVCFLGYPYASSNPLTNTIFNESSVLQWVDPAVAARNGTVQLYATDEHAMLLGVRTAGKPVSAMNGNPGFVTNPAIGDPTLTDPAGRPLFPAVFVTDITGVDDDTAHTSAAYRAGDWQYGGRPNPPSDIFGTWKGASVSGSVFTTDADPATKNGWKLGTGSDTPSVGFAKLEDLGYGTEVRWNVNTLVTKDGKALVPGRTYRLQFMVHDGDQNKTGGDVGQACALLKFQ